TPGSTTPRMIRARISAGLIADSLVGRFDPSCGVYTCEPRAAAEFFYGVIRVRGGNGGDGGTVTRRHRETDKKKSMRVASVSVAVLLCVKTISSALSFVE